jgi:hypothetical protein
MAQLKELHMALKSFIFALALGFALSACTTVEPAKEVVVVQNPADPWEAPAPPTAVAVPQGDLYAKEIASACAAVTAAHKLITVANDAKKVTYAQQQVVRRSLLVTDPICGSPVPPTLTTVAYTGFMNAVWSLNKIGKDVTQ